MPDLLLSSEVPFIRGVFSADFFEPSEILISQLIWLCYHVTDCFKSFLESRIQHVVSKVLFSYIVDRHRLFLESRLPLLFDSFILVFVHIEKMIDIYIQENGSMLHDHTVLPG